jgi:antitoxin VapB
METSAKLFANGRSQAVRIPKAYQFKGVSEVLIRKEGDALIIVPARKAWTSYAGDAPPVGDDFMAERPELMDDDGRIVW